ncbi:MAG: helicase, partial [Aquificota bacterium]
MKGFVSFLGVAYEGAFKVGFLKDRIEDYESFKERQVFERLKGEAQEIEKDSFISVLELLERNVPFEPTGKVPEELQNFGLENSDENYLRFVFLTGYYQGCFYGLNFNKVELIKYHIGEERSEAGVYENADLMFIANKVLYVIDFKLAGILNKLSQIFSLKEGQIPYQIHGLPVNISVGELSFAEFLKNIMKIKNKLLELKEVSPELKGFLQVLSYGVDYLCERGQDNLKEISLSLLYPIPESFSARFYLDGKDITPYRDEVRELYEQLKSREPEYAQAENPSRGTKSRLLRETRSRIDELLKLMQEKEKEDEVIKPDSINLSRQDVGKRLDEFFKREEPVKVLCLLHSAGSGKTSQTRERILKLDGNHIVLYTATRRVLLDREYEVLMRKQQKEGYDIALVYEKRSSRGKERVENIGDTYQSSLAEAGILKRTVDKINEYRGKKRFIWAFITQQAIVETQNGKNTT